MRATVSVVLSVLLASALALAHGQPIGGIAPFFEEGRLVGAGTTWGVVLDEDGTWMRVCEEAPGAPPSFFYRALDGRVLAGGEAGLLISRDGGCTWERPEGALGEHVVGALAVAGGDPARVFVATRSVGAQNGVFRSDDEGARFAATGLFGTGLLFYSLLVTDDGETLVALAQDTERQTAPVFVSRDGGSSFEADPAALDEYAYVRLLGLGEDGQTLALAGALEGGENALLLSSDGLETVEEHVRILGDLTGYGEVAGRRVVLVGQSELRVEREPGGGLDALPGVVVHCLLRVPGDARLWGCGRLSSGGHFLSTSDGETWSPELPYLGVVERLCPEGTPGRERCEQYLVDAGPKRDGGGAREGRAEGGIQRPAEPVCACDAASGRALPSGALLVVGLFFMAWAGSRSSRGCL